MVMREGVKFQRPLLQIVFDISYRSKWTRLFAS